MRHLSTLLSTTALTLAVGAGARAHHATAVYFDTTASIEHENVTVVSFDLVNPHVEMVYLVTDEQGNEVQWVASAQSANSLRRRGMSPNVIGPGDRLTIVGSPSRDGTNNIWMSRAVRANGEVIAFGGRARSPSTN